MKRSKNHNKLISGEKPHIFLDEDKQGFFWTAKTCRYKWDCYKYVVNLIYTINAEATDW